MGKCLTFTCHVHLCGPKQVLHPELVQSQPHCISFRTCRSSQSLYFKGCCHPHPSPVTSKPLTPTSPALFPSPAFIPPATRGSPSPVDPASWRDGCQRCSLCHNSSPPISDFIMYHGGSCGDSKWLFWPWICFPLGQVLEGLPLKFCLLTPPMRRLPVDHPSITLPCGWLMKSYSKAQ